MITDRTALFRAEWTLINMQSTTAAVTDNCASDDREDTEHCTLHTAHRLSLHTVHTAHYIVHCAL